MRVSLFDAGREYEQLAAPLSEAAQRVLASGKYILGDEVAAFEQRVCEYLGVRHCVGVASGTDALMLANKAIGIRPGDRVITTPFSFIATVDAILNCGAEPVFVDVDPATLNLDPGATRRMLTGVSPVHERLGIDPADVKAILPVHLYGQAADLDEICGLAQDFGLRVVEDAAQAFGARYRHRPVGTIGDVGCFSFFPTKNLGGFGDGGMVCTDDDAVARALTLLRSHGSATKYVSLEVGFNSRLDALQAALLGVKLDHLDAAVKARQEHAAAYDAALGRVEGVSTPPTKGDRTHTFHQYVIRLEDGMRDDVAVSMAESGAQTAVHYPVPLHLQPVLSDLGYRPGDFPQVEEAARRVLSLPIFPSLYDNERDFVIEQLDAALSAFAGGLGDRLSSAPSP